ncbi:MAG: ABC transporter substrate-binding protein [Tissierellia bacterium]|nr:ABC transporter substrate-binding protein [Tissierellia bacterium]
MKRFLLIALILSMVFALAACSGNNATKEETKPAETETTTAEKPEEKPEEEAEEEPEETEEPASESEYKRVVAGTVAVSEVLDALEFDDVVGMPVTAYEIPKRYEAAAKIGRPMEPDVEVVKSLEPDLFISVESLKDANLAKLQTLGINSEFINLDSVDHIKESITFLGDLLSKEDNAKGLVKDIDDKIAQLVEKAEGKETPNVLFLFGSPKAIMVGTPKSYVGSLIEKLGVHNVSEDIMPGTDAAYVPINMESIINVDPDMIIRMTHASPEESKKMFDQEFSQSDVWKNMRAVKEGNVVDLENDYFSVSGSVKVAKSLELLFNHIYGE